MSDSKSQTYFYLEDDAVVYSNGTDTIMYVTGVSPVIDPSQGIREDRRRIEGVLSLEIQHPVNVDEKQEPVRAFEKRTTVEVWDKLLSMQIGA